VDIVRALWRGETVTHRGLVTVEEAKLYTRPAVPPKIIGPALSPETAEWQGGWADGLVTINMERAKMRAIVDAFRRGGGEGKPMYLQVHLSWAATEREARANAFDQWRSNVFPAPLGGDLKLPAQFDAAAEFVRPEDLDPFVRISADVERQLAWLREDLALGFEGVYLHNVGRNQREFVEAFGARVVPALAAG
jgi:alkanesulfonate monooxygenase SsuD/methylene tetrahydromethanopterin reductase-like flavin-dependent oxidoreductase (luciferase family)